MAITDNSQALFGGNMLPQDMQQELINQRAQQFAQLTPSQQLGSMLKLWVWTSLILRSSV
jgi:hypothetical protein